ncbi:unnamed protein product [Ilex paraguariensis]|uniref:GIY-YIG domain-containing protein n=1 Tax=Ilex paraguariensis TaxID=185542 RepID=A0ABC8TRR8_9AQUA
MMVRTLSKSFRSLKPHSPNTNLNSKIPKSLSSNRQLSPPPPPSSLSSSSSNSSTKRPWSVYLILSTNIPIKTYVGVTTNVSRRLKQHNGELRGGAKASRAGRPWVCACIIRGFKDKSEGICLT